MSSLEDARDWLRRRLEGDGADCPLCLQRAKIYRRSIHASMARDLIIASRRAGAGEWFHVRTLLGHDGGDFAKLAYWGLIEPKPGKRDDGGPAGWWRITEAGAAFIAGSLRLPKHALTYNKRLLALDDQDGEIDVRDALGQRFDYSELMQGGVYDRA